MQRKEMGVWQRVKDHINQIPGDRIVVKEIPEKMLAEYLHSATANAVGEGGILRIKKNLSEDQGADDLWVGYNGEPYDGIANEELHQELKSFLMRYPGPWRIYEPSPSPARGPKSDYRFTLTYDKTRDKVVQMQEETLDMKRHNDYLDNDSY